MTKVAAEFQISDVGLAKICDNHRMPEPLQPKEGILLDELFSRRIELCVLAPIFLLAAASLNSTGGLCITTPDEKVLIECLVGAFEF
jgi:hypothetical protein